MTDETRFEMPGFSGRVIGNLDDLSIIDAHVDGAIESHTATSQEFAMVMSGEILVTMNGETTRYGPGDYLFVPAGAEHGIIALVPSRLILVGKA
jgi:quercetin dioxygenase-like cupin family protein